VVSTCMHVEGLASALDGSMEGLRRNQTQSDAIRRNQTHSMARWKALPDLASEPTWNETPIMSRPMSNAWLMSVSYSSGFAPVGKGGEGGRRGEHLHAARTHPDSHHL
jgi:hypothetical protein